MICQSLQEVSGRGAIVETRISGTTGYCCVHAVARRSDVAAKGS